jgi:DNA-binding CsgD family transcriptional regulator
MSAYNLSQDFAAKNKIYNANHELIIERCLSGFKVFKPKKNHAKLSNQYYLPDFLNLPLKVAFLDRNSTVKSMNDANALAWGHDSGRDTLGKSINDIYQSNSAKFSIMHDRKVLSLNKLIVEEENCLRIDGVNFQAITAKMPWYNSENQVVGIVALALTLGLNDNDSTSILNSMQNSIQDSIQDSIQYSIQDSIEAFTRITSSFNNFSLHLIQDDEKSICLTRKEKEILMLTMRGKTARLISEIMNISRRTIESHLENIKLKMNVSSKSNLIEKAFYLLDL